MPLKTLPHNAQSTDEEIERFEIAYQHVLRALTLIDRDDPITQRIAEVLVQIGKTGVKEPEHIAMLVIKELGR